MRSSLKSVQVWPGGSIVGGATIEIEPVRYVWSGSDGFVLRRGLKLYELKNHLGNVLAVVSDRKLGRSLNPNVFAAEADYYDGEVLSMNDYYPFGMAMTGRNFEGSGYRYGFNGKEADPSWAGKKGMLDYGFRIQDVRLGRFLSVDPLAPEYPWNSTFCFAENRVIQGIDLEGAELREVMWLTEKMFDSDPVLSVLNFWDIDEKGTVADISQFTYGMAEGVAGGNLIVGYVDATSNKWSAWAAVFSGESSVIDDINILDPTGGAVVGGIKRSEQIHSGDFRAGGRTIGEIAVLVASGRAGHSKSSFPITSRKLATVEIEVSESSIARALEGSNMKTVQSGVSLPAIKRYVQKLANGETPPPIKVADGVLVDGNHRYIAGRILGKEPKIAPGTLSPSSKSRIQPIQKIKVDLEDWGNR